MRSSDLLTNKMVAERSNSSYVELLRGKQRCQQITLGGGQPTLSTPFNPTSLSLPTDHTVSQRRQRPNSKSCVPIEHRVEHRSQPDSLSEMAPIASCAPSGSCCTGGQRLACATSADAHAARISNASANSARALARTRREAARGGRLCSARATESSAGSRRHVPATSRSTNCAVELEASRTTKALALCASAQSFGSRTQQHDQLVSEHLSAAAHAMPVQTDKVRCAACKEKDVELKAKEAEKLRLLHELARSDRSWRDMVALLESQLVESRSR